jgi:hypothetical protein
MVMAGGSCFGLYKVGWNGSFLAAGGGRMVCWFAAPDTESARLALRTIGADARVIWPGTVHDGPQPATPNVLVERRFAAPVTLGEIHAIEEAGAGCLETHRVKHAKTFFSRDRQRMLCLYEAPDAESVRVAQREAGMPVEQVWAFRRIGSQDLAAS